MAAKHLDGTGSQSVPASMGGTTMNNAVSINAQDANKGSMFSGTLSRSTRREGKKMLLDFFHKHIFPQAEVVATYQPFNYLMLAERDVFLVLKSFHTIGGDTIKEKQIDWARAQLIELSREIDLPHCRLHLVMYGSVFEGNLSLLGSVSASPTVHFLRHRRKIEDRLFSTFRFHSIIHRDHTFLWDSSAITPKLGIEIRRLGIPSGAPLWVSWTIPQSPIPISDSPKKPDAAGWEQLTVMAPQDALVSYQREEPSSSCIVIQPASESPGQTSGSAESNQQLSSVFEPTAIPFDVPLSPKPPPAMELLRGSPGGPSAAAELSGSPASAQELCIEQDAGRMTELLGNLNSAKSEAIEIVQLFSNLIEATRQELVRVPEAQWFPDVPATLQLASQLA
ncbi:MAG: hypothetical protein Q8P67_09620, partial [archaeon]|nr:hypothetical protein [archaeon]